MILSSWNINWLRSQFNKWTLIDFLTKENPDVIWLQEIKIKSEQITEKQLEEIKNLWYYAYFNSAIRPWYSWTAIFTKIKPLNILFWIQLENIDTNKIILDDVIIKDIEWRVIQAEFDNFYFINVYTPNSKRELERLDYRENWDLIFLKYIKNLEIKKPVIVCWDFNVAHSEIDLANPNSNKTTKTRPWNAWFTDTERKWMNNYIDNWFIDMHRFLYRNKTWEYTWWSNFWKSREKNIWWRIDYFLISQKIKQLVTHSNIKSDILWSDHCPINIYINNI